MQFIEIETKIAAPIERCFLLSLSMNLHVESTAQTEERAIAGVTHGLIGAGESVTWQGRHFGLLLKHTSLISEYDRPRFFEDSMTRGMFASFVHRHFFTTTPEGTLMRDELRFSAPLGPLGIVAEKFVLNKYLRAFLVDRNALIRRVAASEYAWKRYIGDMPI